MVVRGAYYFFKQKQAWHAVRAEDVGRYVREKGEGEGEGEGIVLVDGSVVLCGILACRTLRTQLLTTPCTPELIATLTSKVAARLSWTLLLGVKVVVFFDDHDRPSRERHALATARRATAVDRLVRAVKKGYNDLPPYPCASTFLVRNVADALGNTPGWADVQVAVDGEADMAILSRAQKHKVRGAFWVSDRFIMCF